MVMKNDCMDDTWKGEYGEKLKEILLMECGGEMELNGMKQTMSGMKDFLFFIWKI